MIINENRTTGLSCVGYNIRKLEDSHAEILYTNKFSNNATGEDIERVLWAYGQGANRAKKYIHVNVNPALEDWSSGKMTKELLTEICKEIASKLYPEQPYVAFMHTDISRYHAHIVLPAVRRDGSVISDSNNYAKCMKLAREIEQKFGLIVATKQVNERRAGRATPVIYQNGALGRQIGDVLALADTYYYQSLGELNAFLLGYNVQVEQINNDKKTGLVYYVTENKERVGRGVVASKIHGGSLSHHMAHFKKSGVSGEVLYNIAKKITSAKNGSDSLKDFISNLENKNIIAVLRCGTDGKAFGITFIDNENKVIINGSKISRGLSLSNINKEFDFNAPMVFEDDYNTNYCLNIEDVSESLFPSIFEVLMIIASAMMSAANQMQSNDNSSRKRKRGMSR